MKGERKSDGCEVCWRREKIGVEEMQRKR